MNEVVLQSLCGEVSALLSFGICIIIYIITRIIQFYFQICIAKLRKEAEITKKEIFREIEKGEI